MGSNQAYKGEDRARDKDKLRHLVLSHTQRDKFIIALMRIGYERVRPQEGDCHGVLWLQNLLRYSRSLSTLSNRDFLCCEAVPGSSKAR
ncbi:hypothetical protein KQX54_019232 [Cotesia glomerata]|uniref:Uncharacterized protein n=1 Tax=Cotesia glomerata TaxID=32391 RepID=A0AAV7IZA3_COTGL|nr:hypothetical protein KQX54_019232 [Cotesia glomerata]